MTQFIFGPAVSGSVVLFTSLADGYYYLRHNPDPKLPPYFTPAEAVQKYMSLNLTVSQDSVILKSGSSGFIQDSKLNTGVLSSTSTGKINYLYSQPITDGTPLLTGIDFQMLVGTSKVTFPWKRTDNQEEYDGVVSSYFIVPIKAYSGANCLEYLNGAFIAYCSGYSDNDWYSTPEWCKSHSQFAPCLNGQVCGTCYGPCSSNECLPVGNSLQCRKVVEEDVWYKKPWIWITIGIAVVIIALFIIFLLVNL